MATTGTNNPDFITPSFISTGVLAPFPSDLADAINGLAGDDFIDGGGGIDNISAGPGDDFVLGGEGGDILQGDAGDDRLLGQEGNDTISGGLGNDIIAGGLGRDNLKGDSNDDVFVFTAVEESGAAFSQRDTIQDFSPGNDRIDLHDIDANINLANDQAFTFIGSAPFTGLAGELSYVPFAGDTILRGDVDGDASADFAIVLNANPLITAADIDL